MTINQATEKWGVTTDVARDRVKIIPGAEKKGLRWNIPENVDLPPITSHNALLFMEFLEVFNEGGKPSFARTGIRLSDVDDGYQYLIDCGYITGRPGKVTGLGKKLMEMLEQKPVVVKGGMNAKQGPYFEAQVGTA